MLCTLSHRRLDSLNIVLQPSDAGAAISYDAICALYAEQRKFLRQNLNPELNEVNDMIERKAKPATKTTAPAKAGSTVARKPNAVNAKVAATASKPTAKKPVVAVAEPKINTEPAVKEEATTVVEKKASATAGANAMPATAQKPMAKPTSEERYRMVETAAYFIAEQHFFQGRSDEHWAAAERKLGL